MSVVDSVADHLAASGALGGWQVFRGYEPPDPDQAVTLTEFAGLPPETTFAADYPSFQVRVRAAAWDYQAARGRAQTVLDALHAQTVYDVDVSPHAPLVYVTAQQQPFLLERDARDRPVMIFNCKTMRAA